MIDIMGLHVISSLIVPCQQLSDEPNLRESLSNALISLAGTVKLGWSTKWLKSDTSLHQSHKSNLEDDQASYWKGQEWGLYDLFPDMYSKNTIMIDGQLLDS